jgi:hypothetical protein
MHLQGCQCPHPHGNPHPNADPPQFQLLVYLCPHCVAAADLERVSVLACKGSAEIKQLSYSQHSWSEVRNCEAGQCHFDEEGHPIVYAGNLSRH